MHINRNVAAKLLEDGRMDALAGGMVLQALASLDDLSHAFALFDRMEAFGLVAGALGLSRFLGELERRAVIVPGGGCGGICVRETIVERADSGGGQAFLA